MKLAKRSFFWRADKSRKTPTILAMRTAGDGQKFFALADRRVDNPSRAALQLRVVIAERR
jgi:hypothetical protein